jgi:hypothetical protein
MKAVITFVVAMCIIGLVTANAATKALNKSTAIHSAQLAAALAAAE